MLSTHSIKCANKNFKSFEKNGRENQNSLTVCYL